MTTEKFRRCHAVTAAWEGGWSDHPADPGGKTMYGITDAEYQAWLARKSMPPQPVHSISRETAEAIFYEDYWIPSGGPTLHDGVDLATYDASVNSGVVRGRKWLLAAIGGSDDQTVKRLCARRLSFVQGLSTFAVFGKGWSNRIADVEAKGVAWALAASGLDATAVKNRLAQEAKAAAAAADKQTAGGAGAAAGGAVTTIIDHGSNLGGWLAAGIVIAAIAAFALFLACSRINRSRAAAYQQETANVR